MKALIYKDLVAVKKTSLLILAVLIVISFLGIKENAALVLPLIFILLPLILLSTLFGLDAQSRIDSYIIPGPVRRSEIVLSRYCLVWLIALMGIIFTLLLKAFTGQGAFAGIPWYLITAMLPFLTTITSVLQLPLMYRFGAEKGRLIFVFLYFIVFFLFSFLGRKKEFILQLMQKLEGFRFSNLILVSLSILAITIILNGVSYAISVAIYSRKEF